MSDTCCAVGRTVSRHDRHRGLTWNTPCDSPAVVVLVMADAELIFCVEHFEAVAADVPDL